MSVINTAEEKKKLSCMYDGDQPRDASSSIRGFLFQDYIAISCLLQDKVEYVCSEFLEDVDVFYDNDRFDFIQAKYYAKSDPSMDVISQDLYYQYLRLKVLRSTLDGVPRLFIHGRSRIEKPTLETVIGYIGLGSKLKDTADYPDDPENWLKNHVYLKETINKKGKKELKKQNKDEQKYSLFSQMASRQTLSEFVNALDVVNLSDINAYKKELMAALAKAYPNPDRSLKDEHWKLVLLGLTLLRIQQRYHYDKPNFDQMRVSKEDFDQYIKEATKTKPERTIAAYLVSIVTDQYEQILKRNDLSELQRIMLDRICRNTIQWIGEIGENEDGQHRLLNTISTEEADEIADYKNKDPVDQLCCMAACKRDFQIFLKYLWKIMLDLCQEKVQDPKRIADHPELFDLKTYLDTSVTDYISLNFHKKDHITHSVILPQAGVEFTGVKRRITERMVNMPQRPEKWFFANNDLMRGKNYYSYSTANVSEDPTIADLGEDTFYIECMQCIHIGEGEWSCREACDDCIFSMKCAKEETEL